MIFVVAPVDAPGFVPNLLACFARQTVEARLIVVFNGRDAVPLPERVQSLHSGARSLKTAMDSGIALARELGSSTDIACKWDCDDEYGPEYLADVERCFADPAVEWSGMPIVRTRLLDGSEVLLGRPSSRSCQGGTIAARLGSWAQYADWTPEDGDDATWCRRMHGKRFAPRGPDGYTWIRRSGSVCPASDALLRVFRGSSKPSASDRLAVARELVSAGCGLAARSPADRS